VSRLLLLLEKAGVSSKVIADEASDSEIEEERSKFVLNQAIVSILCTTTCSGAQIDEYSLIYWERRNSTSAFCECMRFSASFHTTLSFASRIAALTSSPRCAGRQCINSASEFAKAISRAST